jgi:actin-related protein 10
MLLRRDKAERQVYHSRPLFHLARSTPLAGKALHDRLKLLLRYHATYTPPTSERQEGRPVPEGVLTDRAVERVLTEACVVASSRAKQPSQAQAMEVDPPNHISDDTDEQLARELEGMYGTSDQPSKSYRIPHSASPRDGHGTLEVPGWILLRAAEILFEEESSSECETIPAAILSTLIKVSCRAWSCAEQS